MRDIKFIYNSLSKTEKSNRTDVNFLSPDKIDGIRKVHRKFDEYETTPLHNLSSLAACLGVDKIWVKDEARRFGLNAFKVLGSAYAAVNHICKTLGLDIDKITIEDLKEKIEEKCGKVTFATTTDGNHGRGLAWVARKLGQKAVVYMPKGTVESRVENIKKEGALVYVTDYNYDDTIRLLKDKADKNGWILVQDTAWDGYEDIPMWIIQGYGVIYAEIMEQLESMHEKGPTHVFLQAGVGSFPGSIVGHITARFGEDRPATIIVEPEQAACIYKSAAAGDGKAHFVAGDLNTIMAGLACGEPCTIAWNILRDYAHAYAACPDYVAARGMRILSSPCGSDPRIISGESGAPGLGLLSILMQESEYADVVEKLKLGKDARVLIINTEGDTDPVNYRKIVWDGVHTFSPAME